MSEFLSPGSSDSCLSPFRSPLVPKAVFRTRDLEKFEQRASLLYQKRCLVHLFHMLHPLAAAFLSTFVYSYLLIALLPLVDMPPKKAFSLTDRGRATPRAISRATSRSSSKAPPEVVITDQTNTPAAAFQDCADSVLSSPTRSTGPRMLPRKLRDAEILATTRQGPSPRDPGEPLVGFTNSFPTSRCYANAILIMLMNLSPFVGYLNRVHGSDAKLELASAHAETRPVKDVLAHLNDLATCYWSEGGESKDWCKEVLIDGFRKYIANIQSAELFGRASWRREYDAPQSKGNGPQGPPHSDAADYLHKILEIAIVQLQEHGL